MAAKAKKTVFDVNKPGKTPASPNSRSVIGSSAEPVKDQMITVTTDATTPTAPVVKRHSELVLKPLGEKNKEEALVLEEALAPTAPAPKAPDTEPEISKEPEGVAEPIEAPTASKRRIEPISDTYSMPKSKVPETSAEEPSKATSDTRIEELMTNKTYFVPLGKSKAQSQRQSSLGLLLLLLVIVGAAAAAVYFDIVQIPAFN